MIFSWSAADGSASIYGSTTEINVRFVPQFNKSIRVFVGDNVVLSNITQEEAVALRDDITKWIKGGAKGVYEIRRPVAEADVSPTVKRKSRSTVQ